MVYKAFSRNEFHITDPVTLTFDLLPQISKVFLP